MVLVCIWMAGHPQRLDLVGPGVHLDGPPPKIERKLVGAAGVNPIVVEVRVADPRHHGLEVAAPQRGGLPLDHGDIRASSCANASVAPLLRAYPLLGVEAVLRLVLERIPLAFGVPTTTNVLGGDGVPSRREEHAVFDDPLVVIVVGGANQNRRNGPRYVWEIDVRGEIDAVPHGHPHVEAHLHFVFRLGYLDRRCDHRFSASLFEYVLVERRTVPAFLGMRVIESARARLMPTLHRSLGPRAVASACGL